MTAISNLQRDVELELAWDPSVHAEQVGVTVSGEVVQLDGTVNSLWEKWAAENAAMRVKNVKAVANEIKVDWPSAEGCTDAALAQAAINHLEWNDSVPGTVKVKVSEGWITLDGTVEAHYQRSEAERALRSLKGARGILNEILITPKLSVSVATTDIFDAFRRRAIDARHIQVEASDGKVTLRGYVPNWPEHAEAKRTAWGTPGVTSVVDLLTIG